VDGRPAPEPGVDAVVAGASEDPATPATGDEDVVTRSAIDVIVADAAEDAIAADVAEEVIVACVADDQVVAEGALDSVEARAAGQRVVAGEPPQPGVRLRCPQGVRSVVAFEAPPDCRAAPRADEASSRSERLRHIEVIPSQAK
jgi:hypothetical protein